jgi:putative flippase GtrA
MAQALVTDLIQKQAVRQFIKFCIIGATSTVIDVGIVNYLSFYAHWNPMLAQLVSFLLSVSNGFIWNSVWTFRGMGAGRKHQQFVKFVAINIVGLLIQITVMQGIFFLLTGHFIPRETQDKLHFNMGKAVAIVIGSFWNFMANKKWTFVGQVE